MIEASEILARFQKSREFEAQVGGWTFQLRLPTEHEERWFALEEKEANGAALGGRAWGRRVVHASVVGWQGPTLDDLLHDGSKDALPFSPSIAAALLDHRTDVCDELVVKVLSERERRSALAETERKNSSSASAGT